MTENATLEKTEQTINTSAIKDFAVSARRKLKERVELKANLMGFYADGREVRYEFEDDKQYKINGETFDKKQANVIREKIKNDSFDSVIDEVAYTWFNRFIALYFMEHHGYIENGLNVISAIDDLNKTALAAPNYFKNINKENLFNAVQENKSEDIYKELIIAQCNELSKNLSFLFEKISDYSELLFPNGLLNNDSVIREMMSLDKSNWDEVEIIGWLYQYYNQEEKDRVIQAKKRYKKNEIPFATQLFTPKWIVKYMTQNSLGRLWQESKPYSHLKDDMEFYLEPQNLSDEDKKELEGHIFKNILPENIKVFDPACGSGHVLVYAYSLLYKMYEESGYISDEIPALILKNNLFGLDICNRAAQLAQFAVIMRAYQDDKNILQKIDSLNVMTIQESNWIDERVKEVLMKDVDNQLLAQQQINNLVDTFKDAKIYGSIIKVNDFDFDFWEERLIAIQSLNMGLLYSDVTNNLRDKLPQLIKQAKIMQQQYECVITNPPYMGNKYMETKLAEFIQKEYSDVKSDLFSTFIIYCKNKTKYNGYLGFMTPFVWMFISSYENLRKKLINELNISSLIQLEYSGFDGATVPICTFTLANRDSKTIPGCYVKLSDFPGAKNQPIKTLEAKKNKDCGFYYETTANNFHSIPGSPIAYWASNKIINNFSTCTTFKSLAKACNGMRTGDNDKYMRRWYEPNLLKVGFNFKNAIDANNSHKKWFPYNKGGDYRKWYGNNEYIVNWANDGYEIKENTLKNYPQLSWDNLGWKISNEKYYFKESINWTLLSSSCFGVRYSFNGCLFDVNGMSAFPFDSNNTFYLLAFMTTKLCYSLLQMLNPTLAFQGGDISNLPIKVSDDKEVKLKIENFVQDNIQISKDDWDSFETSWDFEQHPLLRFKTNNKIQDSFNTWKQYKEEQFNRLKANEEELNKLFIEIYGLQDEMPPEVADKDITVAKADELREIKSLLSYAVGCMFGRYSLDEKGLVFAGGTFEKLRYEKLEVDEDGILPILSDTWFEDDIVDELKRFLKVAFGELYLNENMQYIANVLNGKSTEKPETVIRNYFLKDFYKDHLQVYKKRPIYWMFTSGKEKAFNCLMYLHRYDKTTLSRIRKDYLHEFQAKLDRAIAQAEGEGNIKLTSLYSKYKVELLQFDGKIKDLADAQIELDLDDGVKVNYGKFKGLLEAEKDVVGKEK